MLSLLNAVPSPILTSYEVSTVENSATDHFPTNFMFISSANSCFTSAFDSKRASFKADLIFANRYYPVLEPGNRMGVAA